MKSRVTNGADRPIGGRDSRLHDTIRRWRDDLVNLTGRNRLLNFRPTRTSTVRILTPVPAQLLAGLVGDREYRFQPRVDDLDAPDKLVKVAAPAPRRPLRTASDVLTVDKNEADLGTALRNLMRRSSQEYLDRGLWVLYLAFGSLSWTDGDRSRYTSPLLLIPVRLVSAGPRQLPTLCGSDDGEPVVNPALSLKLGQLGLALPTVGELDELDWPALLARVLDLVDDRPGWRVDDGVTLSYFSFAKEAMYRDLLDNEDAIAAHAAVQALAGGEPDSAGGGFHFDDVIEDDIDAAAPPEQTPLVLDADASQRACVAAAVAGRSFVLDGPPGTGKSQTIANMIGALLHAGKSVLFVSEKAAALDVVRNRLDAVGLGAYLLELHSHKATRKEVAAALGRALDTVPVPPAGMSDIDLDDARRQREALNAYAAAMNSPRAPLNMSLHEVLGRIAQLNEVPAAPAQGIAPVGLTVQTYNRIRTTAAMLERAWRPAAQGHSFTWRGVAQRGSLEATLYAASSALDRLHGITRSNETLATAIGVTGLSRAAELAAILGSIAVRPPGLPDHWLTGTDLTRPKAVAATLAADLAEISRRERRASEAAGVAWDAIPDPQTVPARDDAALRQLGTPMLDLDQLTAAEAQALAEDFSRDAQTLRSVAQTLSGVAAMLGLPAVTTVPDADATIAVAALVDSEDRPERSWLSVDGHRAATHANDALRHAASALRQAEQAAMAYFTNDILDHDSAGLSQRFAEQHRGLRKLGRAYRTDKKAVAACTTQGVDPRQARDQLQLAVAWQSAATAWASAETRHAATLGTHHYAGRDTDFTRLTRALARADTAIRYARTSNLDTLAGFIAADTAARPDLARVVEDRRAQLHDWRGRLAPAPAPAARPELLLRPLEEIIDWLSGHVAPLRAGADTAATVSKAVSRTVTVGEARHLLDLRASVDESIERLSRHAPVSAEVLGALYAGRSTDTGVLEAALRWAEQARCWSTGVDSPLDAAQVAALHAAVQTPQLDNALRQWNGRRSELLAAFTPDRQTELAADLDDYADAADLIAAFRVDPAGQDEWFAYLDARAELAGAGLDVAVNFCVAEGLTADQVPHVIERALLQEWADHHLQTDAALRPYRAEDRDSLVDEYRRLDKAMIAAATAPIISSCNARRPRTSMGESAVIQREAGKKRKHMPVRELLERSRHVVQAIKPCFMMSPLSVSQYVPSDMRFDVVIFDEASQVPPADAINCIYRGAALIAAGDQKQLPPTNFFAAGSGDDDDEWDEDAEDGADFESVLDLMKGSASFRSLTLRWHYRSRHEALIAFSNSSFYDGRLITFPGAQDTGPDVGVEAFLVAGVYRRGSARDNPIEAAKVAERVIHHFSTRPQLTLGVVSFSEAQAAAIEQAVELARQDRPDLDRHFTEDRLDGFFVKNLESVQGDERDVMIFSIGYGPDEVGKTTMNFGPLNRTGGWRRLNVAITRARYRNEIVSSIRAADITTGANEGLMHLRRYLDYAARGVSALALDTGSGGDAESPFEESVITTIRSWGYDVTPQVGTAGYRIDIGVHHPDSPGVYVLGVECDGFQYHSSRAARDRDRLRDQVLRGLGWNLHRIWGTAWHRNRHGEEERLRNAIKAASVLPIRGLLAAEDRDDHISRPVVVTEAAELDATPDWAVSYRAAHVARLPLWVDPGESGSAYAMRPAVTIIATEEGPVHIAVVHQRLREAWGIGRIGSRIRANIDAAIKASGLVRDGSFIRMRQQPAVVRTPTNECARSVEHVHDDELSLALVNLVRDSGGVAADDLSVSVARLYGWTRRGADISARLDQLVQKLVSKGVLTRTGHSLTLA